MEPTPATSLLTDPAAIFACLASVIGIVFRLSTVTCAPSSAWAAWPSS